MSKLPEIASLWIGPSLGWIERLCLTSFVANGHKVTLFQTEPISNVPDGISVENASDLYDIPQDILQNTPLAHSADIFRLYLQQRSDFVWVDTDAVCHRPFRLNQNGYLTGWVPETDALNNGVMAYPRDSKAIAQLIDYFEDGAGIPPWFSPRHGRKLQAIDPDQRKFAKPKIFRTVFGPHGLTYVARQTGEVEEASSPDVLFPVPWHSVDLFFNPHGGVDGWITQRTLSLHLYTSAIRKWHVNMPVQKGCYIDNLMTELRFER